MKKSLAKKVLPVVLLVACLVGIPLLAACSSNKSSAPEEAVPKEPTYAVQIFVDCQKNLLFSKYDVDVMVDDEKIGNVEHGSEATFEVSLTKGQHELVLVEEGRTSPDGKSSFVVEGEGDKFSYSIHCTKDQIEIKSIQDETEEPEKDETEEPAKDETEKPEKDKAEATTSDESDEEDNKAAQKKAAEQAKREQFAKDLKACEGQSLAHAYGLVKDSEYKYSFKVSSDFSDEDITEDVESEVYARALERATVTAVSINDGYTKVAFTADRPLAISADDNEDLAKILNTESYGDPFVNEFAEKYRGKNIEFDGYVSAHFNHGNYNTRFDYYITSDAGMSFVFEDVNYSSFHWVGKSPDSVDTGLSCHFIAEVEKCDLGLESVPMIYLDPVETSLR